MVFKVVSNKRAAESTSSVFSSKEPGKGFSIYKERWVK